MDITKEPPKAAANNSNIDDRCIALLKVINRDKEIFSNRQLSLLNCLSSYLTENQYILSSEEIYNEIKRIYTEIYEY